MFLNEFLENIKDNSILNKHKELLQNTGIDSRVMTILHDSNNKEYYLIECCDDYYTHTLTKEECIEFSNLFTEIANELA